MAESEKPVKLTVVLLDRDRAVYRAIRQIAAEQGRPVREVVVEALRYWLERQEELEDLAAMAEVEGEDTAPWEQVKEEMRRVRDDERVA